MVAKCDMFCKVLLKSLTPAGTAEISTTVTAPASSARPISAETILPVLAQEMYDPDVYGNSGSISKVEREADERATRHTVIGRRGASEKGDKVIRMKWKWNKDLPARLRVAAE